MPQLRPEASSDTRPYVKCFKTVSKPPDLIGAYILARRNERGLTAKGESWIRQTLPKFEKYVQDRGLSLLAADRDMIRDYLSTVNGVWNKHSNFRAIRAFFNWLEREGYLSLAPLHRMKAPKLPKKVMPRPTLPEIRQLIENAPSSRDRAILGVFTDTGFRLGEVAGIKPSDINWEKQTITVWGKGAKQRVGKFSDTTARFLKEHLATCSPNGNIWGLKPRGIAVMLKRLSQRTGIICNPHSFRRAWTIENIKRGTNLIDVQALGGWDSLDMVRRYAREIDSEDAISRYTPLL